MVDKKYRLIIAFITFLLFFVSFLTYFSYSLLGLLDLFNKYYSIKGVEFHSLNLVKTIGGLVINSFCIPLSIFMGYLIIKEKRDDRNILNCFAVLNIILCGFRIGVEFLYLYLAMKNSLTLKVSSVICAFSFSFSFLLSFLAFFIRKIFFKRVLTYAYCLCLLSALFSSMPNASFGFSLACYILFAFSAFGTIVFVSLSMPWEKGRVFSKNEEIRQRIKKVRELEKSYDKKLISENELYLKYNELNNIKED